ncbi:MAG: VWA domain-containing protein [Spirochaetaceae bacterium]|nr:MAG: VWA domain-containing protein [Spirochaetaceae bacterium]
MAAATPLAADPLLLGADDVRIEQSREGGYNLFVRARAGIGSILITESTVDPSGREANYALRNPEWHPVNGDEPRKLDGRFLNAQAQGRYFLVSSTVREVPGFGAAFQVFIPYVVEYGYPWARMGDLFLGDNSWINIRTFSLPFADYQGAFRDNPFVIRVMQPTPEEPTPREPEPEIPPEPDEQPPADETDHLPQAVEAFSALAEETDGEIVTIEEGRELVETIQTILDETPDGGLDLALVIDTTASMQASIRHVQQELVPMLLADLERHDPLRVGVVLFRDYYDEYLVRHLPFQDDLSMVQQYVNRARAMGGGDIPEAVYEGIYTALVRLEWVQNQRMIILIGDAPPHPRPRGGVTRDMVFAEAAERSVTVHAILLPHP